MAGIDVVLVGDAVPAVEAVAHADRVGPLTGLRRRAVDDARRAVEEEARGQGAGLDHPGRGADAALGMELPGVAVADLARRRVGLLDADGVAAAGDLQVGR